MNRNANRSKPCRMASLCLAMLLAAFCLLSPLSVSASQEQKKTVADALQWCEAQLGKYLDQDGFYGAQCVDLIKFYYLFLGVEPERGDGGDYSRNHLPDGWVRIKDGVPQPGDILIYTGGWGHVAICASENVSYHQNWNHGPVVKLTRPYNAGFGSFSGHNAYWGCIRPDFAYQPEAVSTGAYRFKQASTGLYLSQKPNEDGLYGICLQKQGSVLTLQAVGSGFYAIPFVGSDGDTWCFQKVGDCYVIRSREDESLVLGSGGEKRRYTGDPSQLWVLEKVCLHERTMWQLLSEPTCTDAGKEAQLCLQCGLVLDRADMPARGHTFETDRCISCGERLEVSPLLRLLRMKRALLERKNTGSSSTLTADEAHKGVTLRDYLLLRRELLEQAR